LPLEKTAQTLRRKLGTTFSNSGKMLYLWIISRYWMSVFTV